MSASGEKLWSRGRAIAVLTVSTILVAAMSELLVGALEHAAETLGLTQVFVGVILVALVGNAAEHSTAVMVAMKKNGPGTQYCGGIQSANCTARRTGPGVLQLSVRDAVGFDLYAL